MKARILLVIVIVLLLSLLPVSSALAADDCDHCDSGQAFGQHHAEMAQAGALGADMNPGMHKGFSTCLP